MSSIRHADIQWQENVPVSSQFNDPYFSLENGEAETEYVFLKHNNLPASFKEKSSFVIAETGFGTGLNFFVTAKSWAAVKKKQSHLYYFSVEKFPIALEELRPIHQQWPQYSDFSKPLLASYPGNFPGFHAVEFPDWNITLVLIIGDVNYMLDNMQAQVDAWYLDGFAPSKNPDMWSQQVLNKVAALSHEKTRFSTFTAAGFVKRSLIEAGFEVSKAPGFGKKREMLHGSYKGFSFKEINQNANLPPWYRLKTENPTYKYSNLPVVIVGGGLAGISCAMLLAEKGMPSLIIESGFNLGNGASGNPAGIVLPKINTDIDAASRYYVSAFEYAIAKFSELKAKFSHLQWNQNGVIQYENNKRIEKLRLAELPESLVQIVNQQALSAIAGLEITRIDSGSTNQDDYGLFYPDAGRINPKQLCDVMLESGGKLISTRFDTVVSKLKKCAGKWQLIGSDGDIICDAKNVILANGFAVSELLETDIYSVSSSRGQLSYLPETKKSSKIKAAVCGDGYVLPSENGTHVIGATYGGDHQSLQEADHVKNWQNANRLLPGLLSEKSSVTAGRVSFRTVSEDHMPVVGPAVDLAYYQKNYGDLHHGKPARNYVSAKYRGGLYLSVGHGSRGLITCLSAARYISQLITNKALIEPSESINLTHPARFLIRRLKKKPNN